MQDTLNPQQKDDSMETWDDDRLMAQTQQDNRIAFSILLRRYQARVLTASYQRLGCWAKAEELAQDCFLTIYKKRFDYVPEGHFKAFVYGVVHHLCLNKERAKRREDKAMFKFFRFSEQRAEERKLEDHVENQDDMRQVFQILQTIPQKQRDVLWLRLSAGLSVTEVSETLNIPSGTVKSRSHAAMNALTQKRQEILQQECV